MSDQPPFNPGYGAVVHDQTQGAPPPVGPEHVQPSMPVEPPPQYEPPKSGPYSSPYPQQPVTAQPAPYPQQPAGYPPAPAAYPPQGMVYSGYPAYPQQGFPPQGAPAPQPQGPGYQQVPVITSQTVVVQGQVRYGPNPVTMQCPHCQQMVTSSLGTQTGMLTWLSAGLICLFGCWAGCCLIPFCIPDLQDVTHQCPNCHKHLGTYQRLS